ncbi:MFS transporter [Halorubellus litoreus]|uniref:MFS transporter n=1 Tax=Halorubellus litoreus TaxID=755308 RepID=A0ABD5VBD8_9EURY
MRLFGYLRDRDWSTLAGYALFVALMTAGYYYNITFVQLGLIDLGTRLVGLPETTVSLWMGVLALCTFVAAVATGVTMDRRGWSTSIRTKLRLLLAVVCVQFVLTVLAPHVRTAPAFGAWIVAGSAALGVGFPVSFALAIDTIPVPDRGYVAAAITALTYGLANAIPLDWNVVVFSNLMTAAVAPGIVVLAVLASGRVDAVERVLDHLEAQQDAFGRGRFNYPDPVRTRSLAFVAPLVLMFGVFFVDSLGFLRIIETPTLLLTSWQSPQIETRLLIAGAHVLGAFAAGVLYTNFSRNGVFLWIFALFALSHVLYTTELRVAAVFPTAAGTPSLANPLLYAVAVSFYTTMNFALWPDLATADTIGTHSALGIGLAGWVATFASTAVALYLAHAEVTLLTHLNLVNALALLLLFGLAVGAYAKRMYAIARSRDRRRDADRAPEDAAGSAPEVER